MSRPITYGRGDPPRLYRRTWGASFSQCLRGYMCVFVLWVIITLSLQSPAPPLRGVNRTTDLIFGSGQRERRHHVVIKLWVYLKISHNMKITCFFWKGNVGHPKVILKGSSRVTHTKSIGGEKNKGLASPNLYFEKRNQTTMFSNSCSSYKNMIKYLFLI